MNRERKRGPRGPLVPPWAIIGVVLVGVVVALYLVGTSSGPSTPTTSTQAGTAHHRVRHRHKPRPAPRPQPTTVTLQLKPTASVYVCLVDGQGKALIPGQIFSPGQAIPTKSAPKMKLTLGNASVQMKVNGSVVKVNPSSTSIGFLLQPSGSTSLPTSQQPRCA